MFLILYCSVIHVCMFLGFTLQEWNKISCFRNEDFSSRTQKSEYVEHFVPDEVESECKSSNTVKKDLKSILREVILSIAGVYMMSLKLSV